MSSMKSLSSSHDELSNLSKQLQFHRESLINDPYIKHMQSSKTAPSNSQYFPYYASVEKYVAFADEFHIKLNQFRELLMNSLENKSSHSISDDDKDNDDDNDDHSLSAEIGSITDDSPSTSRSISVGNYLPSIDEDKETVYSYKECIIYISNTFNNDYDSLYHLFIEIGALNRCNIKNIMFYNDYGLVYVDSSMDKILCSLENIQNYCNEKCIDVQVNILQKENITLYITNFDILNGNIYSELMQLFGGFGAVKSLEIITNKEHKVYALLQFENIKNAVQCFTTQNVDGNSLYYGDRLLHIQYANTNC